MRFPAMPSNHLIAREKDALERGGWVPCKSTGSHLKWERHYFPDPANHPEWCVKQVITRSRSPSDERSFYNFCGSVARMNDALRCGLAPPTDSGKHMSKDAIQGGSETRKSKKKAAAARRFRNGRA